MDATGFRLVADRVCERYNSAVCQFSAELVRSIPRGARAK